MKVLMSIKPLYAEQIFQGKKKYEYRRRIFKRDDVSSLVIYESAPVSRVVGEVKVRRILFGTPDEIWEKTHLNGGITFDDFEKYFKGCEIGYAIELCNPTVYDRSMPISSIVGVSSRPPQSFMYI
jgi:predicted transcriptional regulator